MFICTIHLHCVRYAVSLRCTCKRGLVVSQWVGCEAHFFAPRLLTELGVPWRSLAFLGGPWRTLADLPKSLATMPHGNVSHKPWEWPCSQLCLNAGKDLWASGLKFQKWWNTYGTLEKIWKEFHKDKSRGAEKMRICIGRCANGAASLRAAVPCLNMET